MACITFLQFEDGLEEHKEVMELDQQEELPPYMTEKGVCQGGREAKERLPEQASF